MLVTADVFDDRRNLIASVEANRYIATNYSAYFRRTDRSSLTVYDHSKNKALDVRFVNEHAVKITGIFRAPDGGPTVTITDSRIIKSDGSTFGPSCFGSPARGAAAFSF
jgi:hypothetical protein